MVHLQRYLRSVLGGIGNAGHAQRDPKSGEEPVLQTSYIGFPHSNPLSDDSYSGAKFPWGLMDASIWTIPCLSRILYVWCGADVYTNGLYQRIYQ